MTDTVAIATALMFVTKLARDIAAGFGLNMTRERTLLFLAIAAPLLSVAAWQLGMTPDMGWRMALQLGFQSLPVAVGMYEAAKTVTQAATPRSKKSE